MNVRAMTKDDLEAIQKIHELYFKEQFEFPEFFEKDYLCAFVIEGDEGNIISAGGVRTIAESILITNLNYSPRIRKEALLNFLQASLFVAHNSGYDSLHAFVQDEKWKNQLFRYGFKPCKGQPVLIGV